MKYDYLLDSYAWAEFFDGSEKGRKVKDLIEKKNIATSVITLAELSDKCARDSRDFGLFLKFIESKATILLLTRDIAVKSGKLKLELRRICSDISLADAIHFQTAKSFGTIFVTGDPDFKNINDIIFL